MSTSTTTIPGDINYTYEDRASYTQNLQFSQSAPWVAPANVTSVIVECWGAGGGGGGSDTTGLVAGSGGGGGAYSKKVVAVTPGTSYTVTVGAGGAGGATSAGSPTAGGIGGDSWFSTSGTILAKGGNGGGVSGAAGGNGGSAASGIGDTTFSGGNGGTASSFNAGGGGGGSGDAGNGGNASGTTAGTGGLARGGSGGTGPTAAAVGTPGKLLGGAGSGGSGAGGNGGAGVGGIVFLTYTTTTPPPTANTDLTNSFSSVQYGDVAVDDGDYFIQYGSEYVLSEFKRKWTNITDTITITWRGRSTESTIVSPIYLQIYNINSAAWETLARETRVPADTDFELKGTQTTNLSNYYDSNNIVSARVYQLVV